MCATLLYSVSKKRIGVFDWWWLLLNKYIYQILLFLKLFFPNFSNFDTCFLIFLSYFEQASALINELLEQFGNDKLPDDVTDECRGLLADREILINSCATSHDTHLSKLLTVEEGLRNRYVFHSSSIMY